MRLRLVNHRTAPRCHPSRRHLYPSRAFASTRLSTICTITSTVGPRPSYHNERREWLSYAFDPSERPKVGLRSREWTAVAPTEEGVVREMARCLAELAEGRAPR